MSFFFTCNLPLVAWGNVYYPKLANHTSTITDDGQVRIITPLNFSLPGAKPPDPLRPHTSCIMHALLPFPSLPLLGWLAVGSGSGWNAGPNHTTPHSSLCEPHPQVKLAPPPPPARPGPQSQPPTQSSIPPRHTYYYYFPSLETHG